ncbi:unnamed protein product [Ranitomeya imitator]|uniref:ribonuclease H n=1 Tax=Ranitomeya imitator TaxID=111125 RepID=A0ABN9LZX0_9NEOB|nr:unnamed protein product [Ranitomeya imitator]
MPIGKVPTLAILIVVLLAGSSGTQRERLRTVSRRILLIRIIRLSTAVENRSMLRLSPYCAKNTPMKVYGGEKNTDYTRTCSVTCEKYAALLERKAGNSERANIFRSALQIIEGTCTDNKHYSITEIQFKTDTRRNEGPAARKLTNYGEKGRHERWMVTIALVIRASYSLVYLFAGSSGTQRVYLRAVSSIGRRLRERKSVHHLAVLPELKPEPMQCDRTLTRVERQEHRRLNGLCFYCGDSTHAISDFPKRTKRFARSATIGTVQSKFLLSVTLICSLSSYSVMAFVDSGAALNLMDLEYAKRCGFFLEPLQCPIPLRGIDATPLAKNKPQYWTQLTMCMAPAHQEVIRFLVLHNLHDVVVLGLPWLQVHNPVLDWKSMSVSSWGCQGVHGDVPFLSISSSTPSEVPEFLSDYRDVFDEPKSDTLPPHRDCDCAIDLIPGSKFPKGRLFNLSVPEHAAMRSYVKESLEKGHIRLSSSPIGAGFFFVAKKDGSLRPCIDYRLLNKITVKFQYPLPLLSDLFAWIKGASWFTKIDLRGAYNLVRIRQGDEWKTAFNTPEGHFEYLVMPFGRANAPSVFQSFMHDIFREYLDKFLIVYLDDILIFPDDWESHLKQVRTVFQVLRANSLFVKGSKCLFGVQKVSFLGFIFSPSTIEMDPVKVQAIHDWTQPTSLKSLQKFLGFANFYRRFICNFSSIAKPLTDLTKKGADVVNWSSAAVEAFQELKRRFSSAPVLCQPDVSLPFQVEVDASEIGAGRG